MAVRPEEIISKIIIDGSGAEEGTQRVAMSLNVMQNALSRALGGIDPLVKATMQFGREMTSLTGHIDNVTKAQADLTKQSESGATALKLLESRQVVLLEMQKRLEAGTISLGQAQAVLSGKIKTTAEMAAYGQRAFLEFMSGIDQTAEAELEHLNALEKQNSKLKELREILKGSGLDLSAQEAALKKVAAAYDPVRIKLEQEASALVTVRERLRDYREELGLEDSAQRKFSEGKQELINLLIKEGTGFAEATQLLSAYIQAKDPAIKKANDEAEALEKLAAKLSAYRKDLGLAGKDELDYANGRDALIKTLRDSGVSFNEGAEFLAAYANKYDPVLVKEREATTEVNKQTAAREKLKQAMLAEIGDASKTAAAQKAGYQQAVAAADPLYALTLKYEEGLKKLRQGQAAAGKTSEELAADEATLTKQYQRSKKVIEESEAAYLQLSEAGGLSRNSMLMLNASVINTVQSLSAGLPVTMVLMQQLPQLAGAFAQDSSMLAKLTTSTVAFASANSGLLIGLGALTAGFSLSLAAQQSYSTSLLALGRANKLMGNEIGLTKSGIVEFSEAQASAAGVSTSTSRDMVAEFTKVGKIGPAVMAELVKSSKDFAVLSSTDVVEAGKALGKMFSDPAKGAEELSSAFGLLSGAELSHIKALADSGARMAAQTELLEKLKQRTVGAREEVNIFSSSWERLVRNISDAADAYGKYLNTRYGGGTTKQKIDEAQSQLGSPSIVEQFFPGISGKSVIRKRLADLQMQYLDELKLAQMQATQAADNLASKTADDIAKSLSPIEQQIKDAEARLAKLNAGLATHKTTPDLRVDRAVEAQQWQADSLKQLEGYGKGLDANTAKQKMLAEAGVKAAQMGAVAGKIWFAGEQARITLLGQAIPQGERVAAVDIARLGVQRELTAANVQQNAQLSIQAKALQEQADAWMESYAGMADSVGQYTMASGMAMLADARSRAETDALTQAINVNARTRQYVVEAALKQLGTSAKSVSSLQEEVIQLAKVTSATKLGVQARAEAETQAQITKETSDTLAAALAAEAQGETKLAEALRERAKEYGNVARAKKAAGFADSVAQENLKYDHDLELLKERSSLVGASEETKAHVKAQRDVTEYLRAQGKEYSKLSAAEKASVDELFEKKKVLSDQELIIQRQEDAWTTLTGSLGKAFDQVGTSIADAFAKGEIKAVNWGNITKSVIASLVSDLVKMGAINPLQNAVFGTNKGTLFDLLSAKSAGEQEQSGSMGIASSIGSLGQSAYSIYTGSTLGASATNFALSTTGQGMGLSTSAVGATGPVIPQLTATGEAVTSGLGTLGAAAPFGAIGGTLGGMIGSATNSKVIGGLSGAAIGAGAAGLYAAMAGMAAVGGPVGIAVAAVMAAVMAVLGTNKKSVGPNGAGNVFLDSSGAKSGPAAGDNGMGDETMLQVSDAVSKSINMIVAGIGAEFKKVAGDTPFAHFQMFQEGDKWSFSDQNGGGKQEFTNQEAFINALIKTSIQRLDSEGRVSGVNDDVRTALKNTKATKAEDLANDLSFAGGFRKQFDAMAASLDPTNNQLKIFTENSKKIGEQVKTYISDWTSKAAELGLATEGELNAAARKGIAAMMGLGPAIEPLRGLSAVTKQASIEFEAFAPVLTALGYTAAEVADLSTQYTAKLTKAYTDAVGLTQRQGFATIEALADPTVKTSVSDRFASAGLDTSNASINELATALSNVEAAAKLGTLTINDERFARAQLDVRLSDGLITADQYAAAIGLLTQAWTDSTAAAEKQKAADTAATTKKAEQTKAVEDLTARAYKAMGDTAAASAYTQALTDQREITAAVSAGLGDAYVNSLRWTQALEAQNRETEKVTTQRKANEDLTVRALKAVGKTDEADAYEKQLTDQRELLDDAAKGMDAAYIANKRWVQSIEAQAKVTENAAKAEEKKTKAQQASEDLTVRAMSALGMTDVAADYKRGLEYARDYQTAVTAGYSTAYLTGLKYVQGLEDEAIIKARISKSTQVTEDLTTRALKGLGRTQEAEDYSRGLQQNREVQQAVTDGYTDAQIAALKYCQWLENVAVATERAAEAQKASEDLTVRAMKGLGLTDAAEDYSRALEHAREIQEATTKGYSTAYITNLKYVQGLEDEIALKTRAAKLDTARADIFTRAVAATGNSVWAAGLKFDADAATQRQTAWNNGLRGKDLQDLDTVLAAERGETIFKAAQELYVGELDRQITAINDNTQSSRDLITSNGQFLTTLKEALKSRLLDTAISPLSVEEQLKEARRQVADAFALAAAGDETARGNIVNLLNTRDTLAKTYYASSNMSDFNDSQDKLKSLSLTAEEQLGNAEKTVKIADAQLKILQAAKADAQSFGSRTVLGLESLNSTMHSAYDDWTVAFNRVSTLVGQAVNNNTPSQTAQQAKDAGDWMSGWFGRYNTLVSGMNAGTITPEDANSQGISLWQEKVNKANSLSITKEVWDAVIAAANSSTSGTGTAQWLTQVAHDKGVPGYAEGGFVTNGIWNQDSLFAKLAGGEHVTRATSVNAETSPALSFINETGRLPQPANWASMGDFRHSRAQMLQTQKLEQQLAETNAQLATMVKVIDFYGKLQGAALRDNVQATRAGNGLLNSMNAGVARQAVRSR